jgi:hypothetical protein
LFIPSFAAWETDKVEIQQTAAAHFIWVWIILLYYKKNYNKVEKAPIPREWEWLGALAVG